MVAYLSSQLEVEDRQQLAVAEMSNQQNEKEHSKIRKILEKPMALRTEAEIDEMVNMVSKIKFFQERKNLKERDLHELVNAIKFETK